MSDSRKPTFFIRSSENSFTDRQKNIFDQLNLVDNEKKHISHYDDLQSPSQSTSSKHEGRFAVIPLHRKETRHFRGKESIFKKPVALPPKFKSHDIPDYQRHPDKWVKYTLGDVSQDDMSERSNTAAAMTFLNEMAARKSFESEADEKEFDGKIKFKPRKKYDQSCSNTDELDECTSKTGFRNSKLVMPEYVVGREKKKGVKRTQKNELNEKKPVKEIKLSHLDDDDENV